METLKGAIGGGLIALLLWLAFEIAEHRELRRLELEKQSWIEQGYPIKD
jgi:hypothetical protein